MRLESIHERERIQRFLRGRKPGNVAYQYASLEAPFWQHSQWFALIEQEEITALALLCMKYGAPALLAADPGGDGKMQAELLQRLRPFLPKTLYCHLDCAAGSLLGEPAAVTPFFNMEWKKTRLQRSGDAAVRRLQGADRERLLALLQESHPEHLWDEDLFQTGLFWGAERDGELVSVAGVCARSLEVGLAAIGNVATRLQWRGRGLAAQVVAAAVEELAKSHRTICLNVKQENAAALSLYRRIGFVEVGEFDEAVYESAAEPLTWQTASE